MIDKQGYRLNVGVIVCNDQGQLLWARRIGAKDAWQFPQGGIQEGESIEQALYRELDEELGLQPDNVKCLAQIQSWLSYRLPKKFRRYHTQPLCIGQKQRWFLLKLIAPQECIRLDKSVEPEFDDWRWVDYWYPVEHVIAFKREVYEQALREFEPVILEIINSNLNLK